MWQPEQANPQLTHLFLQLASESAFNPRLRLTLVVAVLRPKIRWIAGTCLRVQGDLKIPNALFCITEYFRDAVEGTVWSACRGTGSVATSRVRSREHVLTVFKISTRLLLEPRATPIH
jgi:hypothetical protein